MPVASRQHTVRLQGASAATGAARCGGTTASHTSRLSNQHIASTSKQIQATNNHLQTHQHQCLQTHMLELLSAAPPLHNLAKLALGSRTGQGHTSAPGQHHTVQCTHINSSQQLQLQQSRSASKQVLGPDLHALRLPASQFKFVWCTSLCVSSRNPSCLCRTPAFYFALAVSIRFSCSTKHKIPVPCRAATTRCDPTAFTELSARCVQRCQHMLCGMCIRHATSGCSKARAAVTPAACIFVGRRIH